MWKESFYLDSILTYLFSFGQNENYCVRQSKEVSSLNSTLNMEKIKSLGASPSPLKVDMPLQKLALFKLDLHLSRNLQACNLWGHGCHDNINEPVLWPEIYRKENMFVFPLIIISVSAFWTGRAEKSLEQREFINGFIVSHSNFE